MPYMIAVSLEMSDEPFMVNKLFALVTYHCFRQHRKKVVRQGLIMAWNVR